jgi:hypothetical protein
MTGIVPNEFELPWISFYKWVSAQKKQLSSYKEKEKKVDKEKRHKMK